MMRQWLNRSSEQDINRGKLSKGFKGGFVPPPPASPPPAPPGPARRKTKRGKKSQYSEPPRYSSSTSREARDARSKTEPRPEKDRTLRKMSKASKASTNQSPSSARSSSRRLSFSLRNTLRTSVRRGSDALSNLGSSSALSSQQRNSRTSHRLPREELGQTRSRSRRNGSRRHAKDGDMRTRSRSRGPAGRSRRKPSAPRGNDMLSKPMKTGIDSKAQRKLLLMRQMRQSDTLFTGTTIRHPHYQKLQKITTNEKVDAVDFMKASIQARRFETNMVSDDEDEEYDSDF
mmetsp:Transcript_22065/g.41395  ORF Transcript_22065/g.41395 Transcript_22065/m.41395 type:complete len:288 (-) Transcript_22065:227-1090(-)